MIVTKATEIITSKKSSLIVARGYPPNNRSRKRRRQKLATIHLGHRRLTHKAPVIIFGAHFLLHGSRKKHRGLADKRGAVRKCDGLLPLLKMAELRAGDDPAPAMDVSLNQSFN